MSWAGNDKVFKTYVKGSPSGEGKSPAEKVKDRDEIRSYEDASQFDCFGGILNEGFVDVSFDTKELYNAFLDMAEANQWRCLCLPSTKGGHTYWRFSGDLKGGKDKKLAVGLIADIHNKSTYIPLRVHGVDRFPPDYDVLDGEDYQELPDELQTVDTNIGLWGMDAGEGRNDTLYKYILILQSQLALEPDRIRAVLRNTNRFCFKDPLSDEELEVILRDEAFRKPIFFYKNSFLFDKFAIYLKNLCHVVKINNQLHIYKDGMYVTGYREIEKLMIREIPNLNKTKRREVIDYLEIIAEPITPADARYIAFRNGIYDLATKDILPFSPDYPITNRIEWDYNPSAYSELADITLDKIACNDPEIRLLLEECIGYCFFRRNEMGKAFILTGDKNNGKSTFLDVVKNILGDENVSALDLKELGDRFSTSMMFGKLANIGDDIGDDFLQGSQVSIFKKIVTGNRIKAERKGQDPFEFNPYIKLLFSANDIPRMKDKTGAVLRRLVIIPFNARFSKYLPDGMLDPEYDPYIKYKLVEQQPIEYFIRIGIEGLHRIYETKGFTESVKVQKQIQEYKEENNPIELFINEIEPDEIENEPTPDVYRRYTVFCSENSMQPMGNAVFTKQLCKRLDLQVVDRRINGKKTRIYVPCEW